MITLYEYQSRIISELREKMQKGHKRIIVQSPTGSGKTVVFSFICKSTFEKNKRTLIITDRIELLTETGGTLAEFGVKSYQIKAGHEAPPPRFYNTCVAMAQTLRNRISAKKHSREWTNWFKSFDVVIIDEAHKQEFNDFFKADDLFNGATILGFTATPSRTGKQRQLAEDYTAIVKGPTVNELISLGNLVPDRYFSVETSGIESVKVNRLTGDFDENQMFSKFNRPELYGGVVEEWLKHAKDTITICFCINIKHTIETCREFNRKGIKAKFVTSAVSKPKLNNNPTEAQRVKYEIKLNEYNDYISAFNEMSGSRDEIIEDWKRGEFKVLINAGILTTGFNFKPIQTVIINRATISDNLWLQMIGRGSRPYQGKEYFNILDFGGHGRRLGYYRTNREYSLIHEQKSSSGDAHPVKECGKQRRPGVKANSEGYTPDKNGRHGCGSYIAPSIMICPFCGYLYDSEREVISAELKLIDYDVIPEHGSVLKEPSRFDEIERTAKIRGYHHEWVYRQIALKLGESGIVDYANEKGYSRGWVWRMKTKYLQKA